MVGGEGLLPIHTHIFYLYRYILLGGGTVLQKYEYILITSDQCNTTQAALCAGVCSHVLVVKLVPLTFHVDFLSLFD